MKITDEQLNKISIKIAALYNKEKQYDKMDSSIERTVDCNCDRKHDDSFIVSGDTDLLSIYICKMYVHVDLTFAFLSMLSELFQSKLIDLDKTSSSGCETCDYGSRYETTITIKNITLPKELE